MLKQQTLQSIFLFMHLKHYKWAFCYCLHLYKCLQVSCIFIKIINGSLKTKNKDQENISNKLLLADVNKERCVAAIVSSNLTESR